MSKLNIFDRNTIALIVARRDVAEMDAAMSQVNQAYDDIWPEVQKMRKVPDSELEGRYEFRMLAAFALFLAFHDKLVEMVGPSGNWKTVGVETVLGYWLQSLDETHALSRGERGLL